MTVLKPKLPILNRAHPLAHGLFLCAPLYEGAGDVTRRLTNRPSHLVLRGSNIAWTMGQEGPAVLIDNPAYLGFDPIVTIPAGSDVTFHFRGVLVSHSHGNPGWWRNGSDHRGNNFMIFNDATTSGPWVRWDGTDILKTSDTTPTGSLVSITYVVKSADWVGWYLNGSLEASDTHAKTTPTMDIYDLCFQNTTDEYVPGDYYALYMWTRALTADEVRSLHINPYQMFLPHGYTPTLVATAAAPSPPGTTTTIALAWQDNSESEDGFELQRRASGGTFATVTDAIAADAESYNDTGVPVGYTYEYRLRALSAALGDSEWSNIASETV